MGYGFDNQSGKVLGKSHDGGIDGVIFEDRLGLSKILIQAKRYKSGNKISKETVSSFAGSMNHVQKGVFITTSSFTKDARKYAEEQQQKNLKLIDGDLLDARKYAEEQQQKNLKLIDGDLLDNMK